MKKLTIPFLALAFTTAINANAQDQQRGMPHKTKDKTKHCPHIYLGTSTGINNNSGIIGVNAEYAFIDHFSAGAGVGISSWGTKVYGEGRYYFSPCHRGWAVGAGITHNSGADEVTTQMETTTGKHDVTIQCNPKTNLALSAYHFWNIGKRYNRFYLQAGWSVALTPTKYTVKTNDVLTSDADKAVKMISPGGLVLGLGFSFALDGR